MRDGLIQDAEVWERRITHQRAKALLRELIAELEAARADNERLRRGMQQLLDARVIAG